MIPIPRGREKVAEDGGWFHVFSTIGGCFQYAAGVLVVLFSWRHGVTVCVFQKKRGGKGALFQVVVSPFLPPIIWPKRAKETCLRGSGFPLLWIYEYWRMVKSVEKKHTQCLLFWQLAIFPTIDEHKARTKVLTSQHVQYKKCHVNSLL